MVFKVELEQGQDGRWIAEVVELPGVMAYGSTPHLESEFVGLQTIRVA